MNSKRCPYTEQHGRKCCSCLAWRNSTIVALLHRRRSCPAADTWPSLTGHRDIFASRGQTDDSGCHFWPPTLHGPAKSRGAGAHAHAYADECCKAWCSTLCEWMGSHSLALRVLGRCGCLSTVSEDRLCCAAASLHVAVRVTWYPFPASAACSAHPFPTTRLANCPLRFRATRRSAVPCRREEREGPWREHRATAARGVAAGGRSWNSAARRGHAQRRRLAQRPHAARGRRALPRRCQPAERAQGARRAPDAQQPRLCSCVACQVVGQAHQARAGLASAALPMRQVHRMAWHRRSGQKYHRCCRTDCMQGFPAH